MRRVAIRRARRPIGLAVALTLVAAIAGCAASGPPPAFAPETDATPTNVALTFVAAINAQDKKVLETVCDAEYAKSVEETWFGSHIAVLDVRAPFADKSAATDRGGEAMDVPMTISVNGSDGTLPDNPFIWTYLVHRSKSGDAWTVIDQGQG